MVLLTSVEHLVCLKLNMCLSVLLDLGQRAPSCAGNIFSLIRPLEDISWLLFCSWCHITAWLEDPNTTERVISYSTTLYNVIFLETCGAYSLLPGWVLPVGTVSKWSLKTEHGIELMKISVRADERCTCNEKLGMGWSVTYVWLADRKVT